MKIAAIIPCYKVKEHILPLLERFGNEVQHIIVVDDACPQQSGEWVDSQCHDKRVTVLRHEENQGVGGAVKTGYLFALELGCEILVKVDGDGQMSPELIPLLIAPILSGEADYTKGNRFFQPEDLKTMPLPRLIGNAGHSFLTKLSTGYWQIFDPANGFTALHAEVAQRLPLPKIADRYFFETDMLYRLNTIGAVVRDVPMKAIYADEESNLRIRAIAWEFLRKSLRNTVRRIGYNYFLRGFSLASLELFFGLIFLFLGGLQGIDIILESADSKIPATAGTIMLCALPVIVGFQLLLSFINYDVMMQPTRPLHRSLSSHNRHSRYNQSHD